MAQKNKSGNPKAIRNWGMALLLIVGLETVLLGFKLIFGDVALGKWLVELLTLTLPPLGLALGLLNSANKIEQRGKDVEQLKQFAQEQTAYDALLTAENKQEIKNRLKLFRNIIYILAVILFIVCLVIGAAIAADADHIAPILIAIVGAVLIDAIVIAMGKHQANLMQSEFEYQCRMENLNNDKFNPAPSGERITDPHDPNFTAANPGTTGKPITDPHDPHRR